MRCRRDFAHELLELLRPRLEIRLAIQQLRRRGHRGSDRLGPVFRSLRIERFERDQKLQRRRPGLAAMICQVPLPQGRHDRAEVLHGALIFDVVLKKPVPGHRRKIIDWQPHQKIVHLAYRVPQLPHLGTDGVGEDYSVVPLLHRDRAPVPKGVHDRDGRGLLLAITVLDLRGIGIPRSDGQIGFDLPGNAIDHPQGTGGHSHEGFDVLVRLRERTRRQLGGDRAEIYRDHIQRLQKLRAGPGFPRQSAKIIAPVPRIPRALEIPGLRRQAADRTAVVL